MQKLKKKFIILFFLMPTLLLGWQEIIGGMALFSGAWENIWPFSFLKIEKKRTAYFQWVSRENFLWDNKPKPLRFEVPIFEFDRKKLIPYEDLSKDKREPPRPPKKLQKKEESIPEKPKKEIVIKKKKIKIPKYAEYDDAENIEDLDANEVLMYIEKQLPSGEKVGIDKTFDLPFNEGVTVPTPSQAKYERIERE